jgi:hypothetical protein
VTDHNGLLTCSVDEDLHFFPVTPPMNKPAYNEPD